MELQDILSVVCTTTNTHIEQIAGRSRKENIVTARFIFFYFSRKYTTTKSKEIAGYVNRKKADYFYALNQVDKWRHNNIHFKALFETVNSQLMLSKN